MQPSTYTPGGLAAMLTAITTVEINNNPFLPKKKRDKDDTLCGTLPEHMKLLWLHMEEYRSQTDEIVAKITKLCASHLSEKTRLGAEISEEIYERLSREANELYDALNDPYRTFLALWQIFSAAVVIEFPETSGAEIIGVRENFELVTRTIDNRRDMDDPLDPILPAIDGKIRITVVMKEVKKPDSSEPSAKAE
jgi:hypothetical protein